MKTENLSDVLDFDARLTRMRQDLADESVRSSLWIGGLALGLLIVGVFHVRSVSLAEDRIAFLRGVIAAETDRRIVMGARLTEAEARIAAISDRLDILHEQRRDERHIRSVQDPDPMECGR